MLPQGHGDGQAAAVHGWLLAAHPQQGQHCAVAVPVLVPSGRELQPGLVGPRVDGEEGFTHQPALPPPRRLCPPREAQGLDVQPNVMVLVVLAETCSE